MYIQTVFNLFILLLAMAACEHKHSGFREADGPICVKRAMQNQFIVKFKNQTTVQRLHTTRKEVDRLLAQEALEWAEPNYHIPVPRTPARAMDVRSAQQIMPNIAAEYAWVRGYNGQGIKIAVVDSGVDLTHPLLKGPLRRGSEELKSSPRTDGIDNDGNGFIDDVYGWNFSGSVADVSDETGHGTHIAGIIAGAHDAFPQLRGIAPESQIIAADFMDGEIGDEFNAIRAIDYSLKRGARIINNSWANFCSDTLRSSFEAWQANDVIFVNAAGNDGLYIDALAIFPANLHLVNAITVGSVGHSGQRSTFSNFGKNVFIYAPGEEIFSLGSGELLHNTLVVRSGTSMSTAFVSGAVALVWSAFPDKTAAEIVAALRTKSGSIINVKELFEALDP